MKPKYLQHEFVSPAELDISPLRSIRRPESLSVRTSPSAARPDQRGTTSLFLMGGINPNNHQRASAGPLAPLSDCHIQWRGRSSVSREMDGLPFHRTPAHFCPGYRSHC